MMKKINLKETLKQIVGVLLFGYVCIAEAVSTGCKKLRTLPKKVMALCVAAALVVAMIPTYVFAAGTHTNHCVCGEQESVHSGCKDVEWTAWNGTDAIPYDSNKTAYVYLSANAERASTLTVNSGYTLYLCLNGNTLSPASGFTGRAIEVSSGATFVLTDCGGDGAISGFTSSTGGGGVFINGTFTMYGGTISGNSATGYGVNGDGGGVYNYNGTVTMYGGTISGNTASRFGAGVYSSRGTVTMYGGTISGNIADYSGGGVYTSTSTVTMENVTVSDNTANNSEDPYEANGGGICCYAGTLTIRGGTISGNEIKGTSSYGGGITVGSGATAEITDVTISGNTSAYSGGGITVGNGTTVKITDVTISGNTAYNGGGVCNYGTFTMENSTVSGNTSAYSGGGVYNYGTFTMENSTVSGNTSTRNGGGVYNSVTLNLSGNTKIINNTKGTAGNLTPNNIYLLSDKTVTVAGALTCEDASIGVTMQNYNGGTFATGGAAYIGKFVSDSSTYSIAIDGENLALKFQYPVTFDYGTLGKETKMVLRGETVTPPAPVFAGKVLVGWYTDSSFYTEFNFSDAIYADKTIYAKFADYEGDKKALQDAIDALEADVAELNMLTENGGTIDQFNAKISAIESQVAALDALKNKYAEADTALKQQLQQELQAADAAINSAIAALTTRVQDLEADLAAVNSKVDTNTSDVTALKSDVAALNTWKAQSQSTIAALETLTATQSADIARLKTAVQSLEAELAAANARIDDAEDRIAVLEGKVSALEIAKQNLDAAVAALNAAINNKADTATLNQKVTDLIAAIAAAEDAAKTYADGKDTALQTQLTAAIATAKGEAITAAENLVNTAKAQLQAAIDNKADTTTVNAAIANLQNAITALQNAKDNYIAADAALKAELEEKIAKAKQEAIDAAKGHIPYIGTNGNWWIGDTDTGVDANGIKGDKGDTGADGVGIAKIEKTATNGNVDTYTITLTNGKTYTFTVTNGKDGANGKDGENGKDGADGKDGLTPFIGENGNWWIGENDTGVKAAADDSVSIGSGNVTEAEGVNTVTVVAIVIAGVALLGNVLLAVLVLKKKKSLV